MHVRNHVNRPVPLFLFPFMFPVLLVRDSCVDSKDPRNRPKSPGRKSGSISGRMGGRIILGMRRVRRSGVRFMVLRFDQSVRLVTLVLVIDILCTKYIKVLVF